MNESRRGRSKTISGTGVKLLSGFLQMNVKDDYSTNNASSVMEVHQCRYNDEEEEPSSKTHIFDNTFIDLSKIQCDYENSYDNETKSVREGKFKQEGKENENINIARNIENALINNYDKECMSSEEALKRLIKNDTFKFSPRTLNEIVCCFVYTFYTNNIQIRWSKSQLL